MGSLIKAAVDYMDNYELIVGKCAFTSAPFMAGSIAFFLVSLYLLSKFMEKRQALNVRKIAAVHNYFCSLLALVTGLGIIYGLFRLEKPDENHHYYAYLCAPRGTVMKGATYFWLWIYHIQKYYELIDSWLIVLQKSAKGLSFLHVYHHAVMLMLCAQTFKSNICGMWLPALCNCTVHVVMYYYYGWTSLNKDKRWKYRNIITQMQIVQFLIIAGYFLIFFFPGRLLYKRNCSGNLLGTATFVVCDFIFLILFTTFYQKSFKNKKDKGKSESVGKEVESTTDGRRSATPGSKRND